MSLDIEWSKLDQELAVHVQQFLNRHFKSIAKPTFIGDIEVTAFEWGTEAPQIEITNITDPFPEFYEPENDDSDAIDDDGVSSSVPPSSPPAPPSVLMSPSSELYGRNFHPARLSLNNPLSQQQRFNLIHSFHRSPFVAPQHPFHASHYSPPQHLPYFSSPTTPTHEPPHTFSTTTTTTNTDETAPNSTAHHIQDWIDDDEQPPLPPPSVNSNSQSKPTARLHQDPTEMDFQASMLISYKGDMSMTLLTELRMNYPSMMFISLPIQLRVKSVEFEATAVVAYIKSMNRVCVSMLEPELSDVHPSSGRDVSLESLLRKVHIESVVGDKQKQVLKNVGKIEKFIVDQLRKMLDDELVFPSYQCIQME
ncbi:hypothetical protein O0I10_000047 [Lichtheimia ornata]|uniref:Mitochondrial distribution and morphology protein 12 n=1 Tax=Lichtheimia ornata TaxID=688661 RepID=A0AAD7Y4P5_9FUNG|nr:uncharacterized protein O0I10_000047 [Lichtheimia ornata]KAJ8663774.1 hypothetical protein O0I10_000047 [Lichtheimia ornata]